MRRLALACLLVIAVMATIVAVSTVVRHRGYAGRVAEAERISQSIVDRFDGKDWSALRDYLAEQAMVYERPAWDEGPPPSARWQLKVIIAPDAPSPVWYCGSVQVEVMLVFDREGRLSAAFPTWSSVDCL